MRNDEDQTSSQEDPLKDVSAETRATWIKDAEWEEYKILQDKLDKLGDFQFRVKTWAITLLSAFLIGYFTSNVPWFAVFVASLLIVAFKFAEDNQLVWQKAFSRRVSVLERRLRRKYSGDSPRIAESIQARYDELVRRAYGGRRSPTSLIEKIRSRFRRDYAILNSHRYFYIILFLILGCACVSKLLTKSNPWPQRIELSNPIKMEVVGGPARVWLPY